ncbi:MAG: glycerophosphodiester phosphodiesterase [Bacteriovoracaceae bacterium]|jgi:glycerophosphoryl diester phosphodiesterase|nr:glycerophosphodiester phosphodiesterase [Bacteriovoracaceae bacterium]
MTKILMLSVLLLCSCAGGDKFKVIAHRGLPRLFPEHTLEGLRAVLKYPVHYVEPDVVLTKDDVPVILHDIHLDSTTNVASVFPKKVRADGRFYAADLTLAELKTLRANHRINLKTKKAAIGSRVPISGSQYLVPTLSEFMTVVQNHNEVERTSVGIYLEIKAPGFHKKMGKDITNIVYEKISAFSKIHRETPFIIQCFDDKTLIRLKNVIKTRIPLVQLIGENSWAMNKIDYNKMKTKEGLTSISKYAAGVGPWIPHVLTYKDGEVSATPFSEWAHEVGLVIHPYTLRNDALPKFIKDEKQLVELLMNEARVDGVFTDNAHTTLESIDLL